MKFLLLIFLFTNDLCAQVMWQIRTESSTKWFLYENDEFEANHLETSIWKTGMPWGNYVYGLDLLYSNDNITFDKGIAKLNTKKMISPMPVNEYLDKEYMKTHRQLPNENGDYTYKYSSSAFSSLKKYKYGYFEMRFKANSEKGMWPAFWLYGGDPNEEIDFYEGKGELSNQIHLDVHCPNGCENYRGGFLNLRKNWGAWVKITESLSDNWNIISGEWQANYVKFFLNGEPIGYFEGNFKTDQYLIINSAVAKKNEAFHPGPDAKTIFPNTFLIDYIRVWSQSDTLDNSTNKFKVFENSLTEFKKSNLYSAHVKKKVGFIFKNKILNPEQGTITLLPMLNNKYSLSIVGKKIDPITVDVVNSAGKQITNFNHIEGKYYVMDLSTIDSGEYQLIIHVFNQILTQNIILFKPIR